MKKLKGMVVVLTLLALFISTGCKTADSEENHATFSRGSGVDNTDRKIVVRGTVTELTRYEETNASKQKEPAETSDPSEPVSKTLNRDDDTGTTANTDPNQPVSNRDNPSTTSPADGVIGHLFVEGKKEKDTEYDEASITVTKNTRIVQRAGGKDSFVTFDAIEHGSYVEVYSSTMMESYPPQAIADKIIILEQN